MSPQHVKVCRQKWRQLRCSAVGRSKNLGWEKNNFYENWIVLLLVLPNPEEAAPATPRIRQPWDGMSLCKNILCFGMVKGVCSWFGQKLGIFLWRNKKNYTLAKVHFFQPCTANMITYFQNALYFNDAISWLLISSKESNFLMSVYVAWPLFYSTPFLCSVQLWAAPNLLILIFVFSLVFTF